MNRKFVAVFTEMPNNYCAYLPDLPGCVSTGRTWDEIQEMIREAVEFHIEGMLGHGDPLPPDSMTMEQAMIYHSEPLTAEELEEYSRYGDPATVLSTTFKEIEVEINVPVPVTAG